MGSVRNTLHSLYKKTAEAVLPPLSKSQFEEKRVLTPAEFVAAGDYLVRACPTWAWEGGDPAKARSYFPANKQFLVTRRVPCLSRASEIERYDPKSEFALAGDDEGWVATHQDPGAAGAAGGSGNAADDIPDLDEAPAQQQTATAAATSGEDDVPDISELEIVEPDDEAALPSAAQPVGDALRRTRTYDLYITYDQYYQVPRFWLVGFDEAAKPLTPAQVLEDVSEEHARKTITVDPHPHLATSAASIHPCRYLVLFLKFIASVVPTIHYDFSMSVGNSS